MVILKPVEELIDWSLFRPANPELKAKDPIVEQSSNDKGKGKVYADKNFEAVITGEENKSTGLSSEHISSELGLSLSCSSVISMSEEKKEIRENQNQQIQNPEIGGLSLELSLGFNGACCSNNTSKKRPASERASLCSNRRTEAAAISEEEIIMTELRLGLSHDYDPLCTKKKLSSCDDPWCIRKKLTDSDVSRNMSRLLLPTKSVESHVLPFWNDDQKARIVEGLTVPVWDCDTKKEYDLVFKKWNQRGANVFIKNWIDNFVEKRQLKKGDEIGLYWDNATSKFKFSVLNRKAGH